MMKKIGIVHLIVGAVAIIGALAAAFMILNLSIALNTINSDPSQLPPGTDMAALQESVSYLNTLMILGTIWVISVVLAGLFCIRLGIANLKKVKIKTLGR